MNKLVLFSVLMSIPSLCHAQSSADKPSECGYLACGVAESWRKQAPVKISNGQPSDPKLVSAVHFIARGEDADPSNFTSTGYHGDNTAKLRASFKKPLTDEYDITQVGNCKFEYVSSNNVMDVMLGGKGDIVPVRLVYDFSRLTGEQYYDERPSRDLWKNEFYAVNAVGSKGAMCQENICQDSIIVQAKNIVQRDRTIKAFKYIAQKFCAPEEKPF